MFFASTSEQTRERKTKFNFKEFIQTEANERQTDGKQAWKKGLTMKKKLATQKYEMESAQISFLCSLLYR